MDLATKLRECGVVGAGGAGFPTYVKASARVELLIANGAECEPLIHKDAELMKHFPAEIVSGMELMRKATGAGRARFGIKKKNAEAVEAIRPHLNPETADFVFLGDFYPSGDEYELVYEATGRLIPPAGIPLQVGCVVNNVETLYNVHYAAQGVPVTRKFVSVAGAVREPKAFWVPVGTPFRDLIALAGGATTSRVGVFVSGIMMGTLTFDLDEVVTRTTAGLIVLPEDHYLIMRMNRPIAAMNHIGKSACDQCSYCTEFCPRYLLGYDVQPHKVMRSLGFSATGAEIWNQWAELCCGCGLCTLYACPEDLFPKEACDQAKSHLRAAGIKFQQARPPMVHPMKAYRRVPLPLLRKRLKVEEYESETPYAPIEHRPAWVRIKWRQHAGRPARPVVKEGDRVEPGAVVGQVDPPDLGVPVHASIGGRVARIAEEWVEIQS
ncbi:MAG: 4Fe-4S dicluster domain-containing protein [Bryobacterales bacterium]|nr:4Fe-4S dicluster domain-containing protein [Bryobacteraceae bacterium]MDW8354033.1 4Fe-4S dicluster domain-containing protein [Bryobacterales bacterium]